MYELTPITPNSMLIVSVITPNINIRFESCGPHDVDGIGICVHILVHKIFQVKVSSRQIKVVSLEKQGSECSCCITSPMTSTVSARAVHILLSRNI